MLGLMVANPNRPGTMGTATVNLPSLSWLKISTGLTTIAGVVTLPAVVANAAEVGASGALGSIKARGEVEASEPIVSVTVAPGGGVERDGAVGSADGRLVTSGGGRGMLPEDGGPIRLGAMASASCEFEVKFVGATPIN